MKKSLFILTFIFFTSSFSNGQVKKTFSGLYYELPYWSSFESIEKFCMNNGYCSSPNGFDSTLRNYNLSYIAGPPSLVFTITSHSIDVKWAFDLESSNIDFNKALVFTRTYTYAKSDPSYPQERCDEYFNQNYEDHVAMYKEKYKVHFQSDILDTLNKKVGERIIFKLRPYRKDRYYIEIARVNYSKFISLIREYRY
jgi:hypothetical protein